MASNDYFLRPFIPYGVHIDLRFRIPDPQDMKREKYNGPSSTAENRPTIALTGATGFIGNTLVPCLYEAGWQVRALVRPGSRAKATPKLTAQWVEGSLEDLDSLRGLVAGADAVVHGAGAVRGLTQAQFNKVNVDGVAHLVQAAIEQKPKPRFLLVSSLAARQPELSPYAASKRQGEETLASMATDMEWIALRPPPVYGPGDKEMLPLFRWTGRGIAPILGPSDARVSLLYVEDLAGAVVDWLEKGQGIQGVFELHDGQVGGYTWNDVMDIAARLCQRRIVRIPVPEAFLGLVARLSVLVSRLGGHAPMLTPGKVRELRHPDWVCDNDALTRAIGWAPRFSLAEGLRRTPGWGTHSV